MIRRPKIGSQVQCWYAEKTKDGGRPREHVTLHGCIGTVRFVSKGPGPRNHLVEVDGVGYVVPCGNLRKVQP